MYEILGRWNIHKEACTYESYKRKEQDILMVIINIPIRSLLESIALGLILSHCTLMKSTHTTIKGITSSYKGTRDSWDTLNKETSIATNNISCNYRKIQEPQQLQMKNVMPWCNLDKVKCKKCMHEVGNCYQDSMGMM